MQSEEQNNMQGVFYVESNGSALIKLPFCNTNTCSPLMDNALASPPKQRQTTQVRPETASLKNRTYALLQHKHVTL